jgi:hypothetical protein
VVPYESSLNVKGAIAQTIHPHSTQAEAIRNVGDASLAAHAAPEPVLQLLDGVDAIAASRRWRRRFRLGPGSGVQKLTVASTYP